MQIQGKLEGMIKESSIEVLAGMRTGSGGPELSLQKFSCRTLKRDPTPTVATHLETSSLVNSNYGFNSRRPDQKVQNRLLLTRAEHELQQLHSRLDNSDTTSASGYCLRP